MKQCFICQKTQKTGFTVSHSHKKSKREFTPNLHPRVIKSNNQTVRVKICTQCLKRMGK